MTRLSPKDPAFPHGTLEGWRSACTCTRCALINTRYETHIQKRRAEADARADTRIPNDIQSSLRNIERHLRRITEVLGPAVALIRWTTADGYPAGGTGRGTGVANPTLAAAIRRVATRDPDQPDEEPTYSLLHRRFLMLAGETRALADDLEHVLRLDPRLAEMAWAQARCNGGLQLPGGGEWGDPTCERNATTRDGLCDTCYQRRRRWLERQPQEAR